MHIVSRTALEDFWKIHPDAKGPLQAWYDEARQAKWKTPQDIKNQFGNASFPGNNRVVFNIKGNDYRLIVSIFYPGERMYVKFVGTHAEYDRVNAATVDIT